MVIDSCPERLAGSRAGSAAPPPRKLPRTRLPKKGAMQRVVRPTAQDTCGSLPQSPARQGNQWTGPDGIGSGTAATTPRRTEGCRLADLQAPGPHGRGVGLAPPATSERGGIPRSAEPSSVCSPIDARPEDQQRRIPPVAIIIAIIVRIQETLFMVMRPILSVRIVHERSSRGLRHSMAPPWLSGALPGQLGRQGEAVRHCQNRPDAHPPS